MSRYTFVEHHSGFTLLGGEDRPTTHVYLSPTDYPTHFEVSSEAEGLPNSRISLFQYYTLTENITQRLLAGWIPPADHPRPAPASAPPWLRQWVGVQIARGIGRRLHQQWQRLLTNVDPVVAAVQRKVFAASFGGPWLLWEPALYQRGRVVQAVLTHRAAAAALALVLSLVEEPLDRLSEDAVECRATATAYLDRLEDWEALFAIEGQPYPALRATLHQLPGGIPIDLLKTLPMVRLPRPISDRIELTCALLAAQRIGECPDATLHLFLQAARADCLSAMAIFREAFPHWGLSPRKTTAWAQLVSALLDYPEAYHADLPGLAERTVAWYRQRAPRRPDEPTDSAAISAPPTIIYLPQHPERYLRVSPAGAYEQLQAIQGGLDDAMQAILYGPWTLLSYRS